MVVVVSNLPKTISKGDVTVSVLGVGSLLHATFRSAQSAVMNRKSLFIVAFKVVLLFVIFVFKKIIAQNYKIFSKYPRITPPLNFEKKWYRALLTMVRLLSEGGDKRLCFYA